MKKFLSLFSCLCLLIFDFTLSNAQSLNASKLQNDVLVFIMKDSLEFPSNAKTLETTQIVNVKSKSLKETLSSLNFIRIAKAFPSWGDSDSDSDSISYTSEDLKVKRPEFNRIFVFSFNNEADANAAILKLNKQSSIIFAEKNTNAVLHNDPQYINGTQWHLTNDGRNQGVAGADINALGAWSTFTGSPSTKIAFFDTGIELNHDEFLGRASGDAAVGFYHGTEVAGVAAAKGNNGLGGRGVDWETQILSKRIYDENGLYLGDAIDAQKIVDAVDAGSQILNHSYGAISSSTTVAMSFAYAYKMNRISVASMGNEGSSTPLFPAAYSNVISVGATQNTDFLSPWSNSGSHIDVVAPGGIDTSRTNPRNIFTTTLNNGYTFGHGTSVAAPAVSGLASLMKGYINTLSNDDITQIIRLSATKVVGMGGQNFTNEYGYGRINAGAAINFLKAPYSLLKSTATQGTVFQSTNTYSMLIMGAPGLSTGYYLVKRYEVRKIVTFPQSFCSINGAWGRGVFSSGWNLINPNYGEGFCELVPGTLTSTAATFRTYVYQVYNSGGAYLGYYPTTPANVTFAYSVLGIRTPILSGPFLICSSNSTFALDYLPTGSGVTWDKSSNLSIVSSNSLSCTVIANGNGNGWVSATISGICGTTTLIKNVWVGVFNFTVVTGTAGVCPNKVYRYEAQVPGGHDPSYSYSWTYPSGWTVYNYGQNMIDLLTPSFPSGGIVQVSITNSCGTSGYSGIYVWPNPSCYGYYYISPNPASYDVTITVNKNEPLSSDYLIDDKTIYTVSIYNMYGVLQNQSKRSGSSFTIPLTNLKDGNYIVKIDDGKSMSTKQLIIKH